MERPDDGVPIGEYLIRADELMTDPPAKLTKRGLQMLQGIWEAADRPAKPSDSDVDGAWATLGLLASHTGTNAQRRAAAQVRSHLMAGGYLHTVAWSRLGETQRHIDSLGLSDKAFDALVEAGVISTSPTSTE
jgi:hypothetical protein